MIVLTRLSGTAFVLNADLIERLDCTPDTVVTLADGKKYVVGEQMADIVDRVRAWRAGIIAASSLLPEEQHGSGSRAHLAAVAVHPAVDGER